MRQIAGQLASKQDDPDRLTVLELIGKGAYGRVNRGLWRNVEVAVKTVSVSVPAPDIMLCLM